MVVRSGEEIREGAPIRKMIVEAVRRILLGQRDVKVAESYVELVHQDLDETLAFCCANIERRDKPPALRKKAGKKGNGKKGDGKKGDGRRG